MFDSDFEDLISHQYPKTDTNFYSYWHSVSSFIEPWNKAINTTKNDNRIRERKENTNSRTFYEPNFSIMKETKRKRSGSFKSQLPLSTITIDVTFNSLDPIQNRRNFTISPSLKNKKNEEPNTNIMHQPLGQTVLCENFFHKGFTSTLRHTNLLKLKQNHQNKVKEDFHKVELSKSKGCTPKIRQLKKQYSYCDKVTRSSTFVNEEEREGKAQNFKIGDNLRKPKKASFVGIRKVLSMSGSEKFERPSPFQ